MIDGSMIDVIIAQWQHTTCDSAWPHASMMDSCIQLCSHNGSTELETARGLMHRLPTRAINYARTMEAQSLQQRAASCIDYRFVHSDSSRTMATQSLRQRVASCYRLEAQNLQQRVASCINYRFVHSDSFRTMAAQNLRHASTIGSCFLQHRTCDSARSSVWCIGGVSEARGVSAVRPLPPPSPRRRQQPGYRPGRPPQARAAARPRPGRRGISVFGHTAGRVYTTENGKAGERVAVHRGRNSDRASSMCIVGCCCQCQARRGTRNAFEGNCVIHYCSNAVRTNRRSYVLVFFS